MREWTAESVSAYRFIHKDTFFIRPGAPCSKTARWDRRPVFFTEIKQTTSSFGKMNRVEII